MEMTDKARAARNQYAREWYKKNKERIKEQRIAYWERKYDQRKETEGNE